MLACATMQTDGEEAFNQPFKTGALIDQRKRMMDSLGHYARPELLSLLWDDRPAATLHSSHPHSLSLSPSLPLCLP